MQFLLNTDQHIHGDQRLTEIAEDTVKSALGPLVGRLTRVEVHLRDVNGQKGGPDDIHCVIEARPEGLQPHSVSHAEANVAAALKGAARKLRTHLDSEFGRLEARR